MRKLIATLVPLTLLPVAIHSAGPVRVIVFPLENLSRLPGLAWVGEGISETLTDQLGIPGVEAIDRTARIQWVESADLPSNTPLSRASMIRVGQLASANLVVMGTYSGTADKLRIVAAFFDLRSMKLSGDISSTGPLDALAAMENELAWNIISNAGMSEGQSREKFKARTRTIPNRAYSLYLRSLEATKEETQVKLLEGAVAAYKEFPDAQFALGRCYAEAGQCPKAIQHLELGRKADQSYVQGDFMLGTCYLESDSLSDAIRCYSSLLAFVRPIEALNNQGVAYLRKGDDPLAVQSLLEAHDRARDNSTVALNLAVLRHMQGNDAAARAVLEEPVKAHPSNGLLQFVLGVVLNALGDQEGAAAAFARAKTLHVDVEKLQAENPKSWSLPFTILDRRPEVNR
ncbi:MAG TPA: tetratricopeptide repeat protein [Acidobacteriota bacterium]|nr:tetratricopeptide repeat protein [Acidobacteriota bacterium]